MTQPLTINGIPIETILSAIGQTQTQAKMDEYAWQWYETFKKKKLRPNTQKTYECLLRCHIIPFFLEKPINSIGVSDIQNFYDTKADLSKSTVHQMSIILHQIFRAAIEDKLIAYNPTESGRLSYSGKVKTREALRQSSIQDIIRQLVRLRGSDLLLMALLIYTGERRGEVLGLRWEDIDFDGDMIYVKRAVSFPTNQPTVGQTKSKAGVRPIPLLPALKEILLGHRMPTGYIVGDGSKPLSERAYRRAYERIEKKLDLHGATAHIFRHTFLTMAVDVVDLKTLQTIAGHASHVTTMRYVHKRDEKIVEARTKLTGMFG